MTVPQDHELPRATGVFALWHRIRAAAERWRRPILVVAALVVIGGIVFSVRRLDLAWSDIAWGPVCMILLVLAPLTMLVSALSLQVSGWVLGRSIGFRDSVGVDVASQVAELLPLPGGAVVRGAALMHSGAGLGESAWIVTLGALLTLSLAALAAGVSLLSQSVWLSWIFLAGGAVGTLGSLLWLITRAGLRVSAAMIGVRLALLCLTVLRLGAAFAVIGHAVPSVIAALFAVAATLGNAISIVPSGLGISESLGAALALLTEIDPAAAFTALGVNRLLGLALHGAVGLVLFGGISRSGWKAPR